MNLNENKARFLRETIAIWENKNIIDRSIADKLEKSIVVKPFNWKGLTRLFFCFAILCLVLSFSAFMETTFFLRMVNFLSRIFRHEIGKLVISMALTCLTNYFALKLRVTNPERIFRNESILFGGVLSAEWFAYELSKVLKIGSDHILLSCLIYGIVGFFFHSKMVWTFALLSFGVWFGAKKHGSYTLDLNKPLKFLPLGLILSITSMLLRDKKYFKEFFNSTLCVGLLYLFTSAWKLSINGYGQWKGPIGIFFWSALFAAFALVAMYLGFRENISMLRGFGATFFVINLYTKYVEYLWERMPKTLFFGVLGISFWVLGSRLEKVWLGIDSIFSKHHDNEQE